MEQSIQIFIYIHAFFGGIGLLTGITSVFIQKGTTQHIRLGKWFSWSMIISSLISLVVARLPNHINNFLFLIGVFTIYLVLAGNRALTFKSTQKTKANLTDKLVSGTMFISALVMVGLGIFWLTKGNSYGILFLFFGGFGLFLPIGDYKLFTKTLTNRTLWLTNHLSRMLGALIASITAFLVAGMKYDTLWAWILPSVLGNIYIVYWVRQVKKKPLRK